MVECSWKVLVLLVFASLGIQYTAIKSIRMNFISPCRSVTAENRCGNIKENAARVFCEDENGQESRKHILILATARSGSSFLGQLFNQNPDVFYLYEPLYHVQGMFSNANGLPTLERRSLLGAYRDLLHNLYDCDFYLLENYIKPAPKDHVTSSLFRSGASKALCSPPVCSQSQEFDESKCFTLCRKINLTLASTSCRSYKTMAIKTIRIPEINHMRTLVEDPRLNLKIVHLVRDPRAVLASRLSTFGDIYRSYHIWNSSGRKPHNIDLSAIRNICMDYSNSVETAFSRPSWLRGKYILVRHEDLAKDPIKKTKEIYNFVGLHWKEGLSAWIEENTNATVPPNPHKYSTIRKSAETVENWRLHLHFSIIQTVQIICNTTLSQLGYQMVDSVHQLRNLSHSLVEPRVFLPFI
ncbi:carbohydrate sulfotransferase 1-like [Bufo gargarizans]|uniref:carbohydrate sulfotransferase 1-like n=1 Tax=Bufo gargarizans TaxID=30331 RepID=UPI001CF3AD83|nr:carbohydrate sulfotransferase 1-like [Bufo gargarizans]